MCLSPDSVAVIMIALGAVGLLLLALLHYR